jgi:mannonate dehydratase
VIRTGVRTRSLDERRLRYLRQLGVDDVFVDHAATDEEPDTFIDTDDPDPADTLVVSGDTIPSVGDIERARERVESHGLRLAGIHSLPYALYGDVMFGRPGSDDCVDRVKRLLRNLGAAGVPICGYQWNPRSEVPMRTGETTLRGGARATAWDGGQVEVPDTAPGIDRAYGEAEFWSNYEAFLEAVLPVAEEAGVDLALHPTDPPGIESLGGIPRLFRDADAFERAMDCVPSDNHGLKLCLGCFAELGVDVTEVIRRFGERDEIVFVHFRNVVGSMPQFHETFVDAGTFDPLAAMRALRDVGFEGALLPDHVPEMESDTEWGHRANGYTIGYLRALTHAVAAGA